MKCQWTAKLCPIGYITGIQERGLELKNIRQIIYVFIIETMKLMKSPRESTFKVRRTEGQEWKESFMEGGREIDHKRKGPEVELVRDRPSRKVV